MDQYTTRGRYTTVPKSNVVLTNIVQGPTGTQN